MLTELTEWADNILRPENSCYGDVASTEHNEHQSADTHGLSWGSVISPIISCCFVHVCSRACTCECVCSRQWHKIITLCFCDSNESHLYNWNTILRLNWWKTLHLMMHHDIFQVSNGLIIHVCYPESVCHGDCRPPVTFWVASKHILNCLIVDKWGQFADNLFHVYLLWSWKRNMGLVCMMQWHSSAKKIICKVRRWILTTAHSHPI